MRRTPPLVHLATGSLRGRWTAARNVAVFKGIPYAKPPLGRLRWRPPERPPTWSGVREASRYGQIAPQLGLAMEEFKVHLVRGQGYGPARQWALEKLLELAPLPAQSEDCLYLNVRTPALGGTSKLPVMVWIHGGDHQDGHGSNPLYQTNTLALQGVVLVTINYRVGLIGNFAHPELSAESAPGVSGNYGTLDQIAALTWVRDNIAAFGGDPGRVTIFGESAGGESVAHMMSSPLARGLFHQAILQSPANSGQMRLLRRPFLDAAADEARGQAFASRLGLRGRTQLEQLRALPFERLYAALREQPLDAAYYPTIDGHVLPRSPFAAFTRGDQARVPVLVGSNADEGSIVHQMVQAPLIEHFSREASPEVMPDYMREAFGEDLDALVELYPGLEQRAAQAEAALIGDCMFGAKARLYAGECASVGQPTYLYMFARTPSSPNQTIGAAHSAELPYVHGFSSPITVLQGPDADLSERMAAYWTNFAKTGDPNGHGLARWERFDPVAPAWMHFDTQAVEMRPVTRERAYAIFNRRTARHISAMDALHERA